MYSMMFSSPSTRISKRSSIVYAVLVAVVHITVLATILQAQEAVSMSIIPSMRPNAFLPVSALRNNYYALRHGQSLANLAKIISSEPSVSTVQHGLSDLGKEQAAKAGVSLSKQLLSSSSSNGKAAIFSSDFKRARETAQFVADEMKRNGITLYKDGVVSETKLRERYFGTLNGGSDDKYQSVWDVDATNPNHEEFGVESVNDVVRRTTGLVLHIEQELLSETNDDDDNNSSWMCILVAHGDVLQIMQTGFEKMDGSLHRTLPHLETAVPRALHLEATTVTG